MELLDDLWLLDGASSTTGPAHWIDVPTAGTGPSPGYFFGGGYDPSSNRLIVFAPGVYALDNANGLGGTPTWVGLSPSGSGPTGGLDTLTAVHMPGANKLAVIGTSDVWLLDDANGLGAPSWRRLSPIGLTPTFGDQKTAAYDPATNQLMVVGGRGSDLTTYWILSAADGSGLPRWRECAVTGTPPGFGWSPTQPRGLAASYVAATDQLVLSASQTLSVIEGASCTGSPQWGQLGGVPGPHRYHHTMSYVAAQDRLVVFGGMACPHLCAGPPATNSLAVITGVTSAGGPTGVERNAATVQRPPKRAFNAYAHDRPGDRMIVFGGADGPTLRDDTWHLWQASQPTWGQWGWQPLPPVVSGAPPSARRDAALIFSPGTAGRDSVVVFGGLAGASALADVHLGWATGTTASWVAASPSGVAPAPRFGHRAIYSSSLDRAVFIGGDDGTQPLDEVWALDDATSTAAMTWRQVFASGVSPGPRVYHSAVYDAPRDRVIVFGGLDAMGFRNDVFFLDGALTGSPSWSVMTTTTTAPTPRMQHTSVIDPNSGAMVMYGGSGSAGLMDDVWTLELTGTTGVWRQPAFGSGPGARTGHSAIFDRSSQQMVVFGGEAAGGARQDVWILQDPLGAIAMSTAGNVALNRPATAQSSSAGFPPGAAVDGDHSQGWGSGAPAPRWWRVDLEQERTIEDIVIRVRADMYQGLCSGNPCYDFRIEGSNDDMSWTTMITELQSTAGVYRYTRNDFGPASYRFLRVVYTASRNWSSWVNLLEFEVYGR